MLATKKGLAGMLAAKMHDKEEVSYTDGIFFTEMLFINTESGNLEMVRVNLLTFK